MVTEVPPFLKRSIHQPRHPAVTRQIHATNTSTPTARSSQERADQLTLAAGGKLSQRYPWLGSHEAQREVLKGMQEKCIRAIDSDT
ncbi:hypothetical protein E2C01_046811 [Portunus trituberculatus]|uniref:Uncharacterized protein n=1 Tax=Portunus trituberculatus TaxID=210409 RepID=A0A5B7FYR8_PORTR|nr:hypothetical protein [Portunus trituberculatus]